MNFPFRTRVVTLALVSVLVCVSLLGSPTPLVYARPHTQDTRRPFRMLVLGDSVMWGQGLAQENKFSYKLRDWICKQRNSGQCPNENDVEILVEAHSGAVLAEPKPGREQREEARCLIAPSPAHCRGEVPNSFPSIWSQVDLARDFYVEKGISPATIDLVLVDGGINDMGALKILLPILGGDISQHANDYCHEPMRRLLNKISLGRNFPNARIVITGYFPLISRNTPRDVLLKAIRALFPAHIFPLGTANAILNPAAGSPNESRTIEDLPARSRKWKDASDEALRSAVDEFNRSQPLRRFRVGGPANPDSLLPALFIPIPFEDEHAYATGEQSFLWQLVPKDPALEFSCPSRRGLLGSLLKNLVVNDEQQMLRPCTCIEAKRVFGPEGIKCFRAGAFHPNQKGAARYFETIKAQLQAIWDSAQWAPDN